MNPFDSLTQCMTALSWPGEVSLSRHFAQSQPTQSHKSEVGGTVDASARSSHGSLLREVSGTRARGKEIETDEALALPTKARRCTQLKGANHGVGVDGAVRGGTGIMDHGSYHPEHSTCKRLSNVSNTST